MTRLAGVIAVVVLTAVAPAAQDVERLFKAAMNTELVDGNLTAALEQYRKVADGGNRTLAAQALLRMAECYEKLGDANQAMRIYQRLVREYADRPVELTAARARLGAAPAAAAGDRVVWSGPSLTISSFGAVSPDGRFITGRDRSNGGLMVHDVARNADRPLTGPLSNVLTGHSIFSRDGKQLLYLWSEREANWRLSFRVAPLASNGALEPRQHIRVNRDDIPRGGLASMDWSPDGKSIGAAVRLTDRTGQLGLISVADGSFRVLKSLGWDLPQDIFFSPDGQYLAYDVHAGTDTLQRDVFVIAVDGSREIAAVVHGANDNVLGWSPDGRWLLFSSDRTGSWDLWGRPFSGGRFDDVPELLRSNIGKSFEGRTRSLGVTATGALYVHTRASSREIAIAPIDLERGTPLGPAVSFPQGTVGGASTPVWSPDGQHLAYSCDNGVCIAVRTVATGEVRVLQTLSYALGLTWSHDGKSLLTYGTDLEGRDGIFQVDAQSGMVSRLFTEVGINGFAFRPQWSPDGKKLYFVRNGAFVELEVASGAERIVSRDVRGIGPLSTDGRLFTVLRQDLPTKATILLRAGVDGSEPREIFRVPQPYVIGRRAWTSGSRALIVEKDGGTATDGTYWPLSRELWLVPLDGSEPRKLNIDTTQWTNGSMVPADDGFSLSPDGRSIAFQIGRSMDEVRALENFLPRSR